MRYYSEIIPNLFIGDSEDVELHWDEFVMIVNVTVDIKFPPGAAKSKKCIKRIPVNDDANEALDLYMFLKKTNVLREIHLTLAARQKVIVHCSMGMQRSPAVVACYLVEYEGRTPQEAISFVKSQRKVAFPGGARFRVAIEAVFRDKKTPPESLPSVAVIEPLATLLVQPLRRLAEIVDHSVDHAVHAADHTEIDKMGSGSWHGSSTSVISSTSTTCRSSFHIFPETALRAVPAPDDDHGPEVDERPHPTPASKNSRPRAKSNSSKPTSNAPPKATRTFWHGLEMPSAPVEPRKHAVPVTPVTPVTLTTLTTPVSPVPSSSGTPTKGPPTKSRPLITSSSSSSSIGSSSRSIESIGTSSQWKEIAPRLFLATVRIHSDSGGTGKWHVIVNCTVNLKFPTGTGFKRIRIPVDDDASQAGDLYTFLKKTTCLEDMHNALEAGKRVLLYCDVGMQRSAAVLASYFVMYEGMSPDEAVGFVRGQQADAFVDGDSGDFRVTFQATLNAISEDERRQRKEKSDDMQTTTSSGGGGGVVPVKVSNPLEGLFTSLIHPKIDIT